MELLIELGFPELPASVIVSAEREFGELVAAGVREAGLAGDDLTVRTHSTPRRLAVYVTGILPRQEDRRVTARGPAWASAFAEDGTPTKAAIGFARGQGGEVGSLRREETEQGPYAYADREIPGRAAEDVLGEVLLQAAGKIRFPRTMRWAEGAPRFPRPLQWLLAILGGAILDVSIGPIRAGSLTYGHRVLAPGPWEVPVPGAYLAVLERANVQADREARRLRIAGSVADMARGGGLTAEMPEDLLGEVTDLCEWPEVFLGDFDPSFLEVPAAVLRATMIHHQRFFPVSGMDGSLAPHFVCVRNGGDEKTVRRGNETVLRARLQDALFFFREDRKRSLAERRDALRGIAYAPRLGTLYDRTERLSRLAPEIARMAGEDELMDVLCRAGELSLCDRATAVVRELPELEGEMGAEYACMDGDDALVTDAIGGRVRPRGADDELAPSSQGRILALADRLDQILGFVASGRTPTGSQDPFGLRRAAIGAIRLLETLPDVRVWDALSSAAEGFKDLLGDAAGAAIEPSLAFLAARMQARAEDQGYDPRIVQSALLADPEPATLTARLAALQSAVGSTAFTALLQAARRAKNLAQEGDVRGAEGPEAELLSAVKALEASAQALIAGGEYLGYLTEAGGLHAPLDRFFQEVLVMDRDPHVQARRRAILHRASGALSRIADLASLDVSE